MILFATKKRSTFLNHWDRLQKYWPGTMNIYFIRDRTEKNRLLGIPWHGLVLHKMLNIDCLCSTCQVCQMTKKELTRKRYGLLPPKLAESDIQYLGHGLCGIGGSIYNKDTSQNTLSACTHNDRSSNTSQVGLKLSKPQISQQHPSRICFMIPGLHVTQDLNLLFLTMGLWANSNVSSKNVWRESYGVKSQTNYKLQHTIHKQMKSLSEYTKLGTGNDILRSFDLENNHENL
jgi:hypothetical protein